MNAFTSTKVAARATIWFELQAAQEDLRRAKETVKKVGSNLSKSNLEYRQRVVASLQKKLSAL